MSELHPHQKILLESIRLEMQEEENRFGLKNRSNLKELKQLGVVMHPIVVTRRYFGYADYPEIEFKLPFAAETSAFRENSAIECFIDEEDAVKGVLLGMDGNKGAFRLFAPDFPDWIEEKGVGIKLAPDFYTSERMKKAILNLQENEDVFSLFQKIHGEKAFGEKGKVTKALNYFNGNLNESQKSAVEGMYSNTDLLLIHGPPGTGKTTTLIEGIRQLIGKGERILVSAPSNAAVDNIALGLVNAGVNILRVGNTLKVDEAIYPHTSEGRMKEAKESKEIKKLKIRAEEFRKMAQQYKRRFGKEERDQRRLLINEVKALRKEIKAIRTYFDEKLYENAEVILGTPIGLVNFLPETAQFDTLVIDEAGQAIEPLAWTIFPFAKAWVLAGDPFQLPPTVLSQEAEKLGFNISILEQSFRNCRNTYFLDTQYRMRQSIADFSNQQFYGGKLITPESQRDQMNHITFYDTAGTGYAEQSGEDGTSLVNEGEISIVSRLIEEEKLDLKNTAFISPYAGQVQRAREQLSKEIRISTIDSFQGQEKEIVILSLVRSNDTAVIGFLRDYRRMNVAMTRAKERLIIIGDSSTIGQDQFFAAFLEYMEKSGGYKSAWELMTD